MWLVHDSKLGKNQSKEHNWARDHEGCYSGLLRVSIDSVVPCESWVCQYEWGLLCFWSCMEFFLGGVGDRKKEKVKNKRRTVWMRWVYEWFYICFKAMFGREGIWVCGGSSHLFYLIVEYSLLFASYYGFSVGVGLLCSIMDLGIITYFVNLVVSISWL